MSSNNIVFISYAREDQSWAERLYMDLRKQEINAWLDVRSLKAGANWKLEIRRAIHACKHFILILSKHSVNKKGFVQRELKEALQVLAEFPKGHIFLIPVRLDSTTPIDEELLDLNWVDLTANYHDGLARILSSCAGVAPAPLVVAGASESPTSPIRVIDRGRETTVDMPMVLGTRAAISYAPFRTPREFLQQFFDRLPTESIFADKTISYYLTIDTRPTDVLIGDDLRQKYPEYITLVFQNAFRELQVRNTGFSVVLAFSGVQRTLAIPYAAVRLIQIPEIGVSIHLEPQAPSTGPDQVQGTADT